MLVNSGGNGYFERQAYMRYLARLLLDGTENVAEKEVTTSKGKVLVDFSKPE